MPQQVTLQCITTQPGEKILLNAVFDAFGNNAQLQSLTNGYDGRDDGSIIAVMVKIAHEATVDLDFIGRQALEVHQA